MSIFTVRTTSLLCSQIISLAGLSICATASLAGERSWYIGAGAGVSQLQPETEASPYTLEDDRSTAFGLFLGLDINERFSAEAAVTRLGDATLSDDLSVSYTAISVGGIAYVLGSKPYRHDGLSAYLRFGLSTLENDADIELEKANNAALWLGAGVQYPLSTQWGFRAELASFDGDAQAAMASLYWRPAGNEAKTNSVRRENTIAVPEANEVAPANEPASAPITPTIGKPNPVANPAPEPVATAPRTGTENCPAVATGEPVDERGCALISGVLQGVEFEANSAKLTAIGMQLLQRKASVLASHKHLVVEIRVHTQAYDEAAFAQELSRDRAVAVARYLAGQGVPLSMLRARAFGATEPRATNQTAGGRRLNNRVELRVL